MTPHARRALLAWLAALAVVAAAAALYVRLESSVHGARHVGALAKLVPEPQPKTIPAVAFADAEGRLHKLTAFRGRHVLLNLWATWCAPCVRELPALAHLQAAVGPRRLTVVAVNVGRGTPADTAAFLKAHHAGLSVYLDTNSAFPRAFGAYGLPLSVLIDPQGRGVARAVGAVRWDAPESIAYFKSLKNNN
jgi:thiol-disulfide isomerase/thioredoxin